MIDLEMLHLAAKAISLEVMCWDAERGAFRLHKQSGGGRWNPLADDGDALRLAVQLKIVWAFRGTFVVIEDGTSTVGEALGYAPCEAVRRAIVRAAAEIGRTKCSA